MLRFEVDDPDALFEELRARGAIPDGCKVGNKSWGTREFAFFDRNGNGLTFMRDLRPDEPRQ